MNDVFINKVITIVSKEEAKTKAGTNTKVKLVDQDGVKYSFFKKKKDGELSSPAAQFKDMGLDEGSTVQISWVVDTYQIDGKDITENKVTGFRETTEQPVKGQALPPRPQPAKEPTYHKEEGRNWDKEAYEKCCSIWAASYFNAGMGSDAFLSALNQGTLWTMFQAIRKDGEKRFATGMEKARQTLGKPEEKPFIEPSDQPLPVETGAPEYEVNVADIPF